MITLSLVPGLRNLTIRCEVAAQLWLLGQRIFALLGGLQSGFFVMSNRKTPGGTRLCATPERRGFA